MKKRSELSSSKAVRRCGGRCPSLHRKDRTWNPRHGQWYFRLDVPTVHGAPRKVMKRGG